MPRFVLALITVALSVYAIADCASTAASRVNHLPKPVWLLLVIVLPIAGPIAWLVLGKNRSGSGGGYGAGSAGGYSGGGSGFSARPAGGARGGFGGRAGGGLFRPGSSGPTRPSRPVAPDDDAEFLAQLEREIRRERIQREREERKQQERRGHSGTPQDNDSDSSTSSESPEPPPED